MLSGTHTVYNDTCTNCTCQTGTVTCDSVQCPKLGCEHPTQDGCCKSCTNGCNYQQKLFGEGETFVLPDDPCKTCSCQNGKTCALISRKLFAEGTDIIKILNLEAVYFLLAVKLITWHIFVLPLQQRHCILGNVTCELETCFLLENCHQTYKDPELCCEVCVSCAKPDHSLVPPRVFAGSPDLDALIGKREVKLEAGIDWIPGESQLITIIDSNNWTLSAYSKQETCNTQLGHERVAWLCENLWHLTDLTLWHSTGLTLWHSTGLTLWHLTGLTLWHSTDLTLWHSTGLILWHSTGYHTQQVMTLDRFDPMTLNRFDPMTLDRLWHSTGYDTQQVWQYDTRQVWQYDTRQFDPMTSSLYAWVVAKIFLPISVCWILQMEQATLMNLIVPTVPVMKVY